MEYLQNLSATHLTFVLLSAFLIGASKAGIKGIGLLIVPLMALVFGSKPSTGIVLPMLIMADIMAVAYYSRSAKWNYIIKLLPWTVLGIFAGLFVGDKLVGDQFKWLLAAVIFIMLFILVYNDLKNQKRDLTGQDDTKEGQQMRIPKNPFFAAIMGLAAGFTTMVGNAAGPVFSIYLLAMKLPKKEFIGTGAWFFLIINLSKVPLHIAVWKTIDLKTLTADIVLLPLIALGIVAGIWLVKLFPEKVYRYFVIGMTFVAAVLMLFA